MTISFTQLAEINQPVYHNIIGINSKIDEFDDLTNDKSARAYAHRFTKETIQYHAIDFIFQQKKWRSTRFGNGTYPVWYGSLNLQTSFYETLFHWHKVFILAPQNFNNSNIRTDRTVFMIRCRAALIDLRNQCGTASELINTDINSYNLTQPIGERIQQEGYPGLVTKSARMKAGDNIAIFNKLILSDAKSHGNFTYEYDHQTSMIHVKNQDTSNIEISINY